MTIRPKMKYNFPSSHHCEKTTTFLAFAASRNNVLGCKNPTEGDRNCYCHGLKYPYWILIVKSWLRKLEICLAAQTITIKLNFNAGIFVNLRIMDSELYTSTK